jgi:hypothetical protein
VQPGPRLELIDRDWLALFTGFFLGEGTVSIHPHNQKGLLTATVILCIPQRADNLAFMEDIQRRLGGYFKLETLRF